MWTSRPSADGKRFLLLSPSLKDRVGHYHDYADRVLGAAAALGYVTYLAAHRDHRGDKWRAQPVFRRTCGESQQGGALRVFGPDVWLRRVQRLRGAAAGAPSAGPAASSEDPAAPRGRGRLRNVLQAWRSTADDWADILAAREFALDLGALLDRIGSGPGDLLLLADAGVAEMRGLARALRRRPAIRAAGWAVVLRRDVTERTRPRWSPADWAGAMRELIAAGEGRVRLYADTEGLAELYADLSGLSVAELPIPVAPLPADRSTSVAFQAVYLGDARDEKGFPVMAEAVLEMDVPRRQGALLFTLQSHLNAGAGDPATVRARAALESAGPGVRLVETALDTEAYGQLLGAADVVLTPYDPQAYRVRSSGVMSEALAAGVPVLVTAGSWMAAQVQPAEQAHLAALRDRSPPLAVTAGQVDLGGLEVGEAVLVELDFAGLSGLVGAELIISGPMGSRVIAAVREAGQTVLFLLRPQPNESLLRLAADAPGRIARAWRWPAATPASAVGVIVGYDAKAIRDGLTELMTFRDHYRSTAAANPRAGSHSGQALVERLAADFRR